MDETINILYVEDDQVDRIAFERLIKSRGAIFSYSMATSVEEARRLLESQTFQIIITDYSLDDGTAFDLIQILKDIPVIIVTGAGDEEIAVNAMKAGAYDYLIKDAERNYLKILPITVENALRHRREDQQFRLLSQALMNINDMVSIIDLEEKYVFVNDSLLKICGYDYADLIDKRFCLFYEKNDISGELCGICAKAISEGWKGEAYCRKKNGRSFPVYLSVSTITDKKGQAQYYIGVANDITLNKQSEEALAAEKERLAVTLQSIDGGVIATDTAGKVSLMNKAAEQITGWSLEEAKGRPITGIYSKDVGKNIKAFKNPVMEVLETGALVRNDMPREIITRDGTARMIADNASPIKTRSGNIIGVVLVFRDITEKLKMEEELEKSQKLESLGVLAGGIAHDFNNILTVILGNISLALDDSLPKKSIFTFLEDALKASGQAQRLTKQLLTFSKGGAPIKKNASIADIIKESAEFASHGSNVACDFQMDEDIWATEVDEGQIGQVINNLVINAIQAMPNGGNIRITVENLDERSRQDLKGILIGAEHFVRITIRDQGIGISKTIINRIFDPYFTTKKKGSGLGLATSYSIIRNHGGYLTVESEVDVGTTFTLFLPANPFV